MDEFKGPIIVSGMPRSGTSMMMRILHNSGLEPLSDETKSYELTKTNFLQKENSWLLLHNQKQVVKILYPQLGFIPIGPKYRIIWMCRNPREQAKSQRKIGGWSRNMIHPRKKLIVDIENNAVPMFTKNGCDVLRVRFESLLLKNERVVHSIEEFLGLELDMSCVKKRSPQFSNLPLGTYEA